ncbi:hypothetical protein POSPLADRAFT_1043232 [Postia placenta MAD-698-R-SB12]|uniref:tRNA (cytosine(38)-C(5))-methyltransferase n=1 Tax=Postia placenta MAD-698-R-SB12 TaxID=670580 RepID=A0A1X6NHJ1_9APHY|nr:hypothetical protein POSPLADRAFT_1043232 [Postia placenta MAD-698-R-SB12]OSX68081.1 hypothetical protein POSPLADRAFT_1043232 [Postia placenta MAD-698-R-SB12]
MPIRVLEFYSGIGGLHRALSQSNVEGEVVCAYDWDQCACRVYTTNYGANIVKKVDICTLQASDLAVHQADLWLLSPSCQPYTVLNPLARGAEDPRAKSFIHLIEHVLPQLVAEGAHPSYMLIENVAGFETSSTRHRLLATLESLRYSIVELLLTPLQFGVPNSRLRYYLFAKAKPLGFRTVDILESAPESRVWRHIPGRGEDWVDPRSGEEKAQKEQDPTAEIREYLDAEPDNSLVHPNAVPDPVLEKWGRLFDIVLPSARRSCCFTRGYAKMAERSGSVLQMNEELDTTTVFDRFLAAQRRGEKDAVRILAPLRLRYFSPTELLRLFCFLPLVTASPVADASINHEDFGWPTDLSVKTQYRLIGNSVNVRVVTELINYLFE